MIARRWPPSIATHQIHAATAALATNDAASASRATGGIRRWARHEPSAMPTAMASDGAAYVGCTNAMTVTAAIVAHAAERDPRIAAMNRRIAAGVRTKNVNTGGWLTCMTSPLISVTRSHPSMAAAR